MFKRSGVEKRLRKISKQEALSVKLLEKQVTVEQVRVLCSHMSLSQELELEKALQDNEKMIEKSLSKLSPGEQKIKQEVEKLTNKLSNLTSELEQVSRSAGLASSV